MKPLHIDFVRPALPGRWAWGLCAGLLVASSGLGAFALSQNERAQAARLELARFAQLERERTTPLPVVEKKAPSYQRDAQKVASEAAFATGSALVALERTTRLGVNPVSVELQAESNVARVDVEFSDHGALLLYLEDLNGGEDVVRWQLLRTSAKAGASGMRTALLESRW